MIKLTILCGGCSTEHDITFLSAQNVIDAVDRSRYELTIIYISPQGQWYRLRDLSVWQVLLAGGSLSDQQRFERVTVSFGDLSRAWLSLDDPGVAHPVDVVFPVLHGFHGEDGCIQGLLSLLRVPFVGADTLASSVIMNKVRTREVLTAAHIECVPYRAWSKGQDCQADVKRAFHSFDEDVFIKPVNAGSSVGIKHVSQLRRAYKAVQAAWDYDEWAMMEPAVTGREIEVAVLGNRHGWQAAGPGEIICTGDFYSFNAKYVDDSIAKYTVPADFEPDQVLQIQATAKRVARVLDCEGMCRVDGYWVNGRFLINEVNSIPGFTAISLYPKMWNATGKTTEQLTKDLIDLAFARYRRWSEVEHAYEFGAKV